MLNTVASRQAASPMLLAFIGSLLLSAVAYFLLPAPTVISDAFLAGVAYFQAAGPEQSLLEAYSAWPVYAWLIAKLSMLSGIDAALLTQSIDAVLLALAGMALVAATHLAGGQRRDAWAAALLFLCWAAINHSRAELLRDAGFLFGFSWALVFALRAARATIAVRSSWVLAGIGLLIAGVFRIEGLMLAASLPMVLAWVRADLRRMIVAAVVSFLGLAAVAGAFYLWMTVDAANYFVVLEPFPPQAVAALAPALQQAALDHNGWAFYLGGSAGAVVFLWVQMAWLFMAFAVLANGTKVFVVPAQARLFVALLVITLMIWWATVACTGANTASFGLGASWLLGVPAAIGLGWLWRMWHRATLRRKIPMAVSVLMLLASALSGMLPAGVWPI